MNHLKTRKVKLEEMEIWEEAGTLQYWSQEVCQGRCWKCEIILSHDIHWQPTVTTWCKYTSTLIIIWFYLVLWMFFFLSIVKVFFIFLNYSIFVYKFLKVIWEIFSLVFSAYFDSSKIFFLEISSWQYQHYNHNNSHEHFLYYSVIKSFFFFSGSFILLFHLTPLLLSLFLFNFFIDFSVPFIFLFKLIS